MLLSFRKRIGLRGHSIGEVEVDLLNEPPLRSDAVQVAEQRHFEEHDWINRRLAGVPVEVSGKAYDEGEVDGFCDAPKEVIAGDVMGGPLVVSACRYTRNPCDGLWRTIVPGQSAILLAACFRR